MDGKIGDEEFVLRIRGTCSEAEFLNALTSCVRSTPEAAGKLISLLQRLSRRASGGPSFESTTVDLRPGIGRAHSLARAPTPVNLEPGTILGNRYVIERCLGRGGKGTVFKAFDRYRAALPQSQRYVAVKVLHRAPDSRFETLEALRHELQSAQCLSHPNVIKVFDLGRDGELDFFTMEFLEGELLSDLLARFHPGSMSRDHAWPIIRQISAGLQHAHERGITHADLKPQNVLVTNSGEVRILDFGASHGLSGALERDSGRGSTSSISLAYASCELLDGRAPDARDDLYALACISYEMLAGVHPFQRRRATEARDLGIVPARPIGLSRRRWNTLARGLSWHRAGRSVHLCDWVKGMSPSHSKTAGAALRDIQSFRQPARRDPEISYLHASVAATLLLIAGVAGLLFFHAAPGEQLGGGRSSAPLGAKPGAPTGVTLLSASPAATAKPDLTRAGLQARRPARFAEVRIHRPARTRGASQFVWWTEGASAKPGIDYVSQSQADQAFPAGRDSTSVFVKLLPRPSGDSNGVFYVAVAERGDRNPRHVTHTAVRLPQNDL
jgi:hypothetical protein